MSVCVFIPPTTLNSAFQTITDKGTKITNTLDETAEHVDTHTHTHRYTHAQIHTHTDTHTQRYTHTHRSTHTQIHTRVCIMGLMESSDPSPGVVTGLNRR